MLQYWIEKFRNLVEKSAFGVCQKIGEKLGIRVSKIRMYFIYASFLTFGSPVILYLILAFWMNVKRYLIKSRDLLWD
jgi:phage shock protein PspC (stress-responsive transcriptional regulator)